MIYNLKQNYLPTAMLLCAAGFIGCTSTAQPTGQTNAKPSATIESNTKTTGNSGTGQTATNAVETGQTAADGEKIGVPECDQYIEKYEACVTGKVPESARALMKSSFDQTRRAWKDLAANPNTKSSLAAVCKQSKEMAQKSMNAYQCAW